MLQRIYWIDYKNCSYQISEEGHTLVPARVHNISIYIYYELLVPVIKSDGSIRNCGDFKKTINKLVRTEVYQLATMSK